MSEAIVDQLRRHVEEHGVALAQRALDITLAETVQASSRRTGALAAGITVTQPALSGTRVVAQIESEADYSRYQDEGTGIYGPSGTPIVATHTRTTSTGKVLPGYLVFDWPAAGGVVFALQVQGAPGRHFFHEPMPERWHSAIFESAGG